MAKLEYSGIDSVELSLQQVAALPTDVVDDILNAGADALIPFQRRKAREMGVYDTGGLGRSIKKTAVKKKTDGGRIIHVYAQGSRKRGRKTTRNSEIHFINEFGKKGQKARPFTKKANEAARSAITEAELRVYDEWLKSKDL